MIQKRLLLIGMLLLVPGAVGAMEGQEQDESFYTIELPCDVAITINRRFLHCANNYCDNFCSICSSIPGAVRTMEEAPPDAEDITMNLPQVGDVTITHFKLIFPQECPEMLGVELLGIGTNKEPIKLHFLDSIVDLEKTVIEGPFVVEVLPINSVVWIQKKGNVDGKDTWCPLQLTEDNKQIFEMILFGSLNADHAARIELRKRIDKIKCQNEQAGSK